MSNEKLRAELLAQNGLVSGQLSQERRKEFEAMVASDQKRLRFMRRVTASLWISLVGLSLFFVVLQLFGVQIGQWVDLIDDHSSLALAVLMVVIWLMPLLAILSTVSLYLRSRLAGQREIRMRLELIEDELKRVAQTGHTS